MLSEINELAEDPAKKFLWMTLIMAHEDHASEVIFGTATGGAIPIFYKVNCAWYDMAPFPVKIWQSVRANLISMTNFDSSQEYPRHGGPGSRYRPLSLALEPNHANSRWPVGVV